MPEETPPLPSIPLDVEYPTEGGRYVRNPDGSLSPESPPPPPPAPAPAP